MITHGKTNTALKLFCYLIAVILLSGVLAYSQDKDPFKPAFDFRLEGNPPDIQEKEPTADFRLDGNLSDALFPKSSEAERNSFRLSTRAIPDSVTPGQNMTVEVMFTIAPGYQIYAEETSVTPFETSGVAFGVVKSVTPSVEKDDPYRGKLRVYEQLAIFELPVSVDASVAPGPKTLSVAVRYIGCTEKVCFLPQKKRLDVAFTVTPAPMATGPIAEEDIPKAESNPFRTMADRFGPMGVLLAAFIWGFLASLTPCVYPMIPVTISVIGAASAGSTYRGFVLSVFYVLGMSLVYAVFGVIAAWSGGLFGAYVNHPAVRVMVAGIFVILALGMFDLFYIQVPSSVASKFSGHGGTGIVGVFITGAAAGAVVGPCIGPMLAALLVYIATIGSKLQGFLIMWNFALGLGMLFLIIGTFSGAAASLPRAGIWMERLKRFFGVIMLAAALYYVQPLLPENVFMLLIGALLIGVGVFAGAFDALTAESADRDRLWKAAGVLCLVLGIGYALRFTLDDRISLPHTAAPEAGIEWIKDEAAALTQAGLQKKPVMIDFSADWCTACKRLERETFVNPAVVDLAKAFICLRIDCTDTENPKVMDIQKKYNIVGLPTIIFMNSSGRILWDKTITEFVTPTTLLKRMRGISE